MCIIAVSALAAEWIEISISASGCSQKKVSALAAEWIEIILTPILYPLSGMVSALAAEWIEILAIRYMIGEDRCLRPRGGVD